MICQGVRREAPISVRGTESTTRRGLGAFQGALPDARAQPHNIEEAPSASTLSRNHAGIDRVDTVLARVQLFGQRPCDRIDRLDQSVDVRGVALVGLEGCGPNALAFEFMVMVHRADASRSPLRAGQLTWVALVAPLRQLPRAGPCP
jgi:hypothetical protein